MKHPEQKYNEVFISNSTMESYFLSLYSSKRLGDFAYDSEGGIIPHVFPMFVKTEEYDEWMKECKNLGIKRL